MNKKMKLINNYYLIKDSPTADFPYNLIDIKNLSYRNLKNNTLLKINLDTINRFEYKSILKKLFAIKKKYNSRLGIKENNSVLIGFLLNFDENNDEHVNFINALSAIFCDTLYEMYEYIYNTACKFLDEQFFKNNLCDFKNNKCVEKRCSNSSSLVGCCNHYKYKFMPIFIPNNRLVPCEYLKNKQCTAQCISCKLFTCDTLRKKGITFKIKDILILDTFFNFVQKYIIKVSTFTPKTQILKKLLLFK